jgi:hypothetical protein
MRTLAIALLALVSTSTVFAQDMTCTVNTDGRSMDCNKNNTPMPQSTAAANTDAAQGASDSLNNLGNALAAARVRRAERREAKDAKMVAECAPGVRGLSDKQVKACSKWTAKQ